MNYQARCHCGRVRFSFRSGVLGNFYCRHCGIFVYIADGEGGRDGYRVNLGCVEGLDTFSLAITRIDGKSVPLVERHWTVST